MMSPSLLRSEEFSYLLDVNSGPGKHIHQLRVMSAVLVPVAQTKISIASPHVHF